jgi:serine/threonine protein kinase
METQIISLPSGGGTQILTGGSTTETGANFTGGLLQIHENVAGWEVTGKLGTLSGEADIYIAQKDGQKGVIKYYRSVTKPNTEILEKLKQLNHPDIVNIYDFGLYNDRFYEIMEYAEGGALDTRNADGSYRYLPLAEEKVEGICKEIINSFKTCHEKNIIHRDIKPANIYFRTLEIEETESEEGKKTIYRGDDVIIADFGISSVMDETEELHKTRTGSRTTGYAAPEILSGTIDPKLDYYALGITLWELLTGKDPFTLDNGKRRNDAHLLRDTIEGRIADDILSKEPRVSQRMERLIRGLLVIDPKHRWGYNEVTRHLAGEDVPIEQKREESWSFSIGETECTTLEALGSAIMENPETAKKYIFRGRGLSAYLENFYPDISKEIVEIAEETSSVNDHDTGIMKIAYLLNPELPLAIANDYEIQNLDDLIFYMENAPESAVSQLRDEKTKLYTWLDIMGYKNIASEIRKLPGIFSGGMGDTELAGKAEVLLKNKIIKPFKLAKYADFELSTLEQLRKVPKDMHKRLLTLVEERSYEGLFLPWLELLAPNADAIKLLTEYGLPKSSGPRPALSAGARTSGQSGSLNARQLNATPLNANVFWKVVKPLIGNRRLSIEIKPNRALTRLPKFVLCASLQGQYLQNHTGEDAQILTEIPEQELDPPQMTFKKDYEIISPVSSQLTKHSKLFLYALSSDPNECYSLRWAEGFTGKI